MQADLAAVLPEPLEQRVLDPVVALGDEVPRRAEAEPLLDLEHLADVPVAADALDVVGEDDRPGVGRRPRRHPGEGLADHALDQRQHQRLEPVQGRLGRPGRERRAVLEALEAAAEPHLQRIRDQRAGAVVAAARQGAHRARARGDVALAEQAVERLVDVEGERDAAVRCPPHARPGDPVGVDDLLLGAPGAVRGVEVRSEHGRVGEGGVEIRALEPVRPFAGAPAGRRPRAARHLPRRPARSARSPRRSTRRPDRERGTCRRVRSAVMRRALPLQVDMQPSRCGASPVLRDERIRDDTSLFQGAHRRNLIVIAVSGEPDRAEDRSAVPRAMATAAVARVVPVRLLRSIRDRCPSLR